MARDVFIDRFCEKQMISEASEISNKHEITRIDMDHVTERSHRRLSCKRGTS